MELSQPMFSYRLHPQPRFLGTGLALALALAPGSTIDGLAGEQDGARDPATASSAAAVPAAEVTGRATTTNRFEIRGMHCEACARGIAAELKLISGVSVAEVSFPKKLAVVGYDSRRVGQAQLVRAIREAGYEAVLLRQRKKSLP